MEEASLKETSVNSSSSAVAPDLVGGPHQHVSEEELDAAAVCLAGLEAGG